MSMNPGVTFSPHASISSSADARMCPTSATRPPLTATSASTGGAPVPSNTSPPRTTSSVEIEERLRPPSPGVLA